jgi:hypothetical protein
LKPARDSLTLRQGNYSAVFVGATPVAIWAVIIATGVAPTVGFPYFETTYKQASNFR